MARDPQCIFCRIISAEIPAAIVYEDDAVLSFLDIGPLAEGHLLVIPREHFARLTDMPDAMAGQLGRALPRLGRALMSSTGAAGFNVLLNQGTVAGQVVLHVHVHLIPRSAGDGLGYRWNPGTYPTGRAAELAAACKDALRNQG